jgi:hypothetical protein
MKILIYSTTLDGEPLQADGIALKGKNCAELVDIMKGQTPFTIAATTRDYMLGVLGKIETEQNFKLPEEPEAAAAEFLTTLAKYGLVEFLPDDVFIDLPPNETLEKEDELCADK